MIGYTVNSKVTRFVKSRRKGKTLVTKAFLSALDAEIERMVVVSAETNTENNVTKLQVAVPDAKISDRLVCDVRIKQRVAEINPEQVAGKQFLSDLNTYAGAIIITSIELIEGAYMTHLAAGDSTAKVADRVKAHEEAHPDAPQVTITNRKGKATNAKFEAALPREHVEVEYTVCVQKAIITCSKTYYTAKTTEKLHSITATNVQRCMELIGVVEPAVVEITAVKRIKSKK